MTPWDAIQSNQGIPPGCVRLNYYCYLAETMKGIFTSSPKTLADAIKPIMDTCARFDWAISLQSGPFRELHFTDEDDPRNVLGLFHEFSDGEPFWFRSGVLPKHASNLVFDEWSYYLGFDSAEIDPQEFHRSLGGDVSPRSLLFDTIETVPSVYLIFVDDGWWEAYSMIDDVCVDLKRGWNGRTVHSSRWAGRNHELHPFPDTAK